MLRDLLSHPITVLLFAVGLPLLLFYRSRRLKRFSYQWNDLTVVSSESAPKGRLELRYDGAVVPNVSRSLVRFWNSGSETIDGSDLVASHPLRWQLPDESRVLDATVLRVTREATGVSVTPAEGSVQISFGFLDSGDGAIFEVLHTGIAGKARMRGTLKGIHGGLRDWNVMHEVQASPRKVSLPGAIVKSISAAAGITLIMFFFFFGLTAVVGNIFPDLVLRAFPAAEGLAGIAPGKPSLGGVVQGLFFLLFAGLASLGAFLQWQTRPPARLR